MLITFTKLKSGSWGLRISVGRGESISVGAEVEVSKRDGSVTKAIVGRILWSGDAEDGAGKLALAEIAKSKEVSA